MRYRLLGGESGLKQILRKHTLLFSGAEDLGLPDDNIRFLVETVAVATRTCRDSLGNDRIARLTNLIKLRFLGDFRRFRRSFAERHEPVSSDFARVARRILHLVYRHAHPRIAP